VDVDTLRSIPLFAELSDESLHAIELTARELSVSEGTHIVDEGNYSYDFSIIADGTAQVVRGDKVIAELGPGDFFGEVGLLEKEQRNASVIATSPARLLMLTAWDLRRLGQRMPAVVEKIRRAAVERHVDS
jgi:CRP/FNR family transcriptional regulator, cyclic AMP receptor protein